MEKLNVCMQDLTLSLAVHLGLEATLINYENIIVMAVFKLHTVLTVLHVEHSSVRSYWLFNFCCI